jgi:SAM-dependent methyltransferase
MQYNDSEFDCISMVNVYVYNDDPLPAFLEIVRVIKPYDYFSFNSAL